MELGVIINCFKLPLHESIALAGKMGFDGVQIYATGEEFSVKTLDGERKEYFKRLLAENNLKVSALCGDMGGHGFERAEESHARIENMKRVIDLTREFGAKVVTTHIGVIPEDKRDAEYGVMLSALTECGRYAKSQGVTLAIETGPETAVTLYEFLRQTDGGVGVNLDPANFVMVTGQDPVEAVYLLRDYIVHTHVKDGRRLKPTSPKIIYDHFAEGGIEALNVADYFIETPLGQGDVDFERYIGALREIGYEGFLTIERETGGNYIEDITLAQKFIEKLM